jgi:hypothetical protein
MWKVALNTITLTLHYILYDLIYYSFVFMKLAKTREDIMHGMDEFLDQVTVLPPGQWDPEIRIDPPTSVPSQVNTTILFFVKI